MRARVKELYQQLESAKSIDEKVQIYRRLTFEFLNNDIDRCADIIDELLAMSTEHDHALGMVEAYAAKGRMYYKLNELDKAIEHFQQALSLADQQAHATTISHILLGIGIVYFSYGKLDMAEDYFKRALAVAEEKVEGTGPFRASCIAHLGNIMLFRGQLDQAETYYMQAIDILKDHPENRGALANAKGDLAFALVKKEQRSEAIEVLLDCLVDFQTLGHKLGEAQTLINIGHCYNSITDRGEAIKYFQKAQKLSKELNNKAIDAQLYNGFGEVYLGLGGHDEALAYLDKAERLSIDTKRIDQMCNTWNIKVKVLYKKGLTDQAEALLVKLKDLAAEHGLEGYHNDQYQL